MNYTEIAYCILLLLTIIVIVIYLYNRSNKSSIVSLKSLLGYKELFTNDNKSNPIVNLPTGDIHFISDNNSALIDTPIYNYKLKIKKTQEPGSAPSRMNDKKLDTFLDVSKNNNTKISKTDINGMPEDTTDIKYISVFMHREQLVGNTLYKPLGQYILATDKPLLLNKDITINNILDKRCLSYLASSSLTPIDYQLVWTSDINQDNEMFSAWHPIPPPGCIALGDVIVKGTDKPSSNYIACFPVSMLELSGVSNGVIWQSINDMGKLCYCWGAGNTDTFRITNSYNKDMNELNSVYNLPLQFMKNNTLHNTSSKNIFHNPNKGIQV